MVSQFNTKNVTIRKCIIWLLIKNYSWLRILDAWAMGVPLGIGHQRPALSAIKTCASDYKTNFRISTSRTISDSTHFSASITDSEATVTMADTQLIESMPELLKSGLEIYNTLKADMERALGLKKYAEHLSHITQTLKEVNHHLNEQEREIVKKLNEAYAYSEEGLEKATVVVSVIREQTSALVLVLSDLVPGANHDKVWTACQYFSAFAEKMEAKVNEAQDALRKASQLLFASQNDIRSIVDTLKRVQDEFIAEKKAAKAKNRSEAYGGAAVGLIFGPIGLIISYSIAAGVTEGMSIPNIEADFAKQREVISGYITGFETMRSETNALQKELDGRRKKLIEIHAKLSATGVLAGNTALKAMPMIHFNTVRQTAEGLLAACDEFLATLR